MNTISTVKTCLNIWVPW